jgi:hypothetical protein
MKSQLGRDVDVFETETVSLYDILKFILLIIYTLIGFNIHIIFLVIPWLACLHQLNMSLNDTLSSCAFVYMCMSILFVSLLLRTL